MESRGLDASAIGVLLAIPTVVRVLVTAPLMSLADTPKGARRLLVLGTGRSGHGLRADARRRERPRDRASRSLRRGGAGAHRAHRRPPHHRRGAGRPVDELRAHPRLGLGHLSGDEHRGRLRAGPAAAGRNPVDDHRARPRGDADLAPGGHRARGAAGGRAVAAAPAFRPAPFPSSS
jgi:hypothetical protein